MAESIRVCAVSSVRSKADRGGSPSSRLQCHEVLDELLGQDPEFDVRGLRPPFEKVECPFRFDLVDQHEHPLGLVDDLAALGDAREGFGHSLFAISLGLGSRPPARRHVDVEAAESDRRVGVVAKLLADDDDLPRLAMGVDDAMAGTDGAVRAPDVLEGFGDFGVVVGVFVGQQQFGRWLGGARLVSVNLLDLGRPLPPLVGEMEPEPSSGRADSPTDANECGKGVSSNGGVWAITAP